MGPLDAPPQVAMDGPRLPGFLVRPLRMEDAAAWARYAVLPEVKALTSRWGFQARGWHRIQATTLVAHERSQRVLQRCGFHREGLLRHFRVVRGRPEDYWMYSILPADLAVRDGP